VAVSLGMKETVIGLRLLLKKNGLDNYRRKI
jgi:hypothetical protein